MLRIALQIRKKVCVCFVFQETKADVLNSLLIVDQKFNMTEMNFLILLINDS